MAFKNLLSANQAVSGRFLKNMTGMNTYNSATISYATNPYNSNLCVKCVTDGTALRGLWLNVPNSNVAYSASLYVYVDTITTFSLYLGGHGADKVTLTANPGLNVLKNENHIPVTNNNIILATSQARTFYYLQGQLETGSTATSWQFPGIDMTGQSIPANTNVNNLKFLNTIRLFGIESTEHIPNLTLENILTLTNIPSEEYVNNITLLNEIILEGIESTTSIHDLIIYIKCNYLNLRFEMKYPSTSFKLKQPHTTFKMKYP